MRRRREISAKKKKSSGIKPLLHERRTKHKLLVRGRCGWHGRGKFHFVGDQVGAFRRGVNHHTLTCGDVSKFGGLAVFAYVDGGWREFHFDRFAVRGFDDDRVRADFVDGSDDMLFVAVSEDGQRDHNGKQQDDRGKFHMPAFLDDSSSKRVASLLRWLVMMHFRLGWWFGRSAVEKVIFLLLLFAIVGAFGIVFFHLEPFFDG